MGRSVSVRIGTPLAVALTFVGSAVALATPSSDGPSAESVPGHVLVQFAPGVSTAEQATLTRAAHATGIGTIDALRTSVLSVPAGAEQHVIDALQRSGRVTYAELDGIAHADGTTSGGVTPNDSYWGSQWGPQKVNAPAAWSTTTGSSSVLVADVDTGADLSHPDLQGKLVAGYDFINNDSNPSDDNGHGTSTAGIIAAASNNGTGIAGLCWSCKIMPVKALNSSGSGSYSAIANAITYAADHGAQIINLSLGGASASTTLYNAVAYAHSKGILLAAAAGNSGNTTYNYPGAYAETLSVAGTTSTDKLYSWSNYGSWVDVAAPGCDYATAVGGGYNSNFCGTSAATPVVAGLAALLKSAGATAGASTLESAIQSTAVGIGSVVKYGRIDAAAAMAAMGSTPSPTPTNAGTATYSDSLNNHNPSRSYMLSTGTGQLTVKADFTRASTLTITVSGPSGTTSRTLASGQSLTTSVTTGSYTITVSGASRATYTLTVTYPTP